MPRMTTLDRWRDDPDTEAKIALIKKWGDRASELGSRVTNPTQLHAIVNGLSLTGQDATDWASEGADVLAAQNEMNAARKGSVLQ